MNPNLIVGAVSAVIGLAYFLQALTLPKAAIGSPWAPLLFPMGLGAALTVLGLFLVLMVLVKDKKIFTEKKEPVNKDFLQLMIGTNVAMVVYAFLFDRIGFVASSLLFMGAVMFMINGRKAWVRNVVVAVIFTLSIWYGFSGIFKVNLP